IAASFGLAMTGSARALRAQEVHHSAVIASQARKSITPLSLRAKRGNLSLHCHYEQSPTIHYSTVITSEAWQAITPLSLRAKRAAIHGAPALPAATGLR